MRSLIFTESFLVEWFDVEVNFEWVFEFFKECNTCFFKNCNFLICLEIFVSKIAIVAFLPCFYIINANFWYLKDFNFWEITKILFEVIKIWKFAILKISNFKSQLKIKAMFFENSCIFQILRSFQKCHAFNIFSVLHPPSHSWLSLHHQFGIIKQLIFLYPHIVFHPLLLHADSIDIGKKKLIREFFGGE